MFTLVLLFFFNDPATTEIYTLSLHDALPICSFDASTLAIAPLIPQTVYSVVQARLARLGDTARRLLSIAAAAGFDWSLEDRKSTRLNSSHANISYAVFCLKKKKKIC